MPSSPYGSWYIARPSRAASDPNVRVSDAERNAVAETLSQHYSDGRLDSNELKERLDRAIGAKTRGDLAGLTTDLPPLAPPAPPPTRHRRVALWVALAALFVAVAFPWQATHWIWFPHIPWLLIGLVALFVWGRGRRHRRWRAEQRY